MRHVVYSSVGSAHRETGIPHFDSKGEIEEYKCQTDLPYTILRPVFLYAELGDDARPDSRWHLGSAARPRQTTSAGERRGHRRLRFHGFREPDDYLGCEVDLAGDELTMPEMAETLSQVTGRKISCYQVP